MINDFSLTRAAFSHCAARTPALVAVARLLTRRAFFILFPAACACARGDMRGLADGFARAARGGFRTTVSPLRQTKFAGVSLNSNSRAFGPASDGGAS